MQTHFVSLLETLDETVLPTLSEMEAQSLYSIQKYISSKPDLSHLSYGPTANPSVKPQCPICFSPIDFYIFNNQAENTTEQEFSGFSWNLQLCQNRHRFPICVLTLLPCESRFRTCDACHVVCLEKPGQSRGPQPTVLANSS